VDVREYKSWREDGVAFKLRRDAPYETPNRTLASGVLVKQVWSGKREGGQDLMAADCTIGLVCLCMHTCMCGIMAAVIFG